MVESSKRPRRRSARIVLRIPLLINSVSAQSETEWEPVETVMVSLHGGMLRARQNFQVGDTLDIRVRNKERSARAKVVWASSEVTSHGIELGFEILDQDGFWEINFPPDRWSATPEAGAAKG
jgi:PilZ domain